LIINYKQGMAPVDKYQLKSQWYKEKFTLPISFTTLSEEECNSFNMFYSFFFLSSSILISYYFVP
jgi:hypothetical protein